jgi:charged multivesicular body protein 4
VVPVLAAHDSIMSLIAKMFGTGRKGEKAPTTGDAIQKLRETEEMLQKKVDFYEKKKEAELEIARKNAKTNKRAAMAALKRKAR